MRTLFISVFSILSFFIADAHAQTGTNNAAIQRQIFLRNQERTGIPGTSRAINSELGVRRAANSSMRQAREALKLKRFIRKERTKLKNASCGKKYNAYIQHECYAYDSDENPQDSIALQFNELVVLRKTKKDYYIICVSGQEFYVLKDGE